VTNANAKGKTTGWATGRHAKDKRFIFNGRNLENGFNFHDLWHTFATNAGKASVEKNVIMVIMGHSAGNDFNFRYDSVDEVALLNAVDQIEAFWESVDHWQKNGPRKESQNRATN
jgi:hypothetical protein